MTKLGRFGKIVINHAPGHTGYNNMTGWWVAANADVFAGVACQEDHQFHKNWLWGYGPMFIGLIMMLIFLAYTSYPILALPSLVLSAWGLCNVSGKFTKRRQKIEVEGQVIEALIAQKYYGRELEAYLDQTAIDLDLAGYREKGLFKNETREDIRRQCVAAIPSAAKWLEHHELVVAQYLVIKP